MKRSTVNRLLSYLFAFMAAFGMGATFIVDLLKMSQSVAVFGCMTLSAMICAMWFDLLGDAARRMEHERLDMSFYERRFHIEHVVKYRGREYRISTVLMPEPYFERGHEMYETAIFHGRKNEVAVKYIPSVSRAVLKHFMQVVRVKFRGYNFREYKLI